MGKVIRPRYPMEFSIGLLLLVFALSFFLSGQIFQARGYTINEGRDIYPGMFLVSCAVVLMLLVLWEEFLFPVKVKAEGRSVIYRNHRNKLKKQLLIYLIIPVIFTFLYFEYEVNMLRFIIWTAVCVVSPVAGKLISGINNYNDFLKFTQDSIEYKNNEKTGIFKLSELQQIILVRDNRNVLHKIQLLTTDNNTVIIDIDEMELEAFYLSIDKFVIAHYKDLVK